MAKEKVDREVMGEAALYFADAGTPYGGVAEVACDNFFEMLDALKAVQKVLPVMPPDVWAKVNEAVANAENAGD